MQDLFHVDMFLGLAKRFLLHLLRFLNVNFWYLVAQLGGRLVPNFLGKLVFCELRLDCLDIIAAVDLLL